MAISTLEPSRTAAFYIPDRQIASIKEEADKRGVSQATIVREALEAFFSRKPQAKKDES